MTTVHLLLIDQSEYDESDPDLRVESAHPSEQSARLRLAEIMLGGHLPGPVVRGARIDTVDMPGELAQPYDQADTEAIASVIGRGVYGRPWSEIQGQPRGGIVTDVAREVMSVVGQRMADAQSIAYSNATADIHSVRLQLSAALGGPADLDDQRTRWSALLGKVRQLASAKTEGVERAYRAHWAMLSSTAWESANGHAQAETCRVVDPILEAYWGPVA